MSATDELRRMLDERGVEHEDRHTELAPDISGWDSTWWHGIAGLGFQAVSDEAYEREGCVYVNGTYLTPEQAVAATLGGGECENVAPDYLDFLCSVCGFVHYHSDENDTGDGNDWAYCPRCGKAVKR